MIMPNVRDSRRIKKRIDTKEGILFKVEAKSLMEARLDDMKAGNGISLAEFTAIPI